MKKKIVFIFVLRWLSEEDPRSVDEMSSASSDKLHTPFSHKVFQFFFATHIPATVILDSQALLPKWCYPQAVAAAGKWYCDTFADPLMSKM
jgi:hypothetical protein